MNDDFETGLTDKAAGPARRFPDAALFLAKHPLFCCLAVALAIRLPTALFDNNFLAPDEIAQYIEQAHRLVYQHGPVPWEYQVGLRSWVIPGILAPPIWAAKSLSLSPHAGLVLVRLLVSLASLSIVWCAFQWGRLYQGVRSAWIMGGLAAAWPDLWLMAPHPLEEALAAYSLVPAAYLATLAKHRPESRHVLTSGFLLGLTFILREQLAPAIAIIGLYLCGRNMRFWLLGVGAGCVPLLFAGALDWLSWGQPFRSFWLNIYLNVFLGVSSKVFGASPAGFYVLGLAVDWLWSITAVIFFAWRGARLWPAAGLAAIAIIAEHSLIPHKEFRFVFPAIALIVPLAGIGLAQTLPALPRPRRLLILLFLLSGPFASPFLKMALFAQTNASQLYGQLAARHPCLVAVEIADTHFMPIAPLFAATEFTTASSASEADAIVARKDAPGIPPGFVRQSCVTRDRSPAGTGNPEICYWTRPTGWCGQTGDHAPFEFGFPAAARRFRIAGG